MQIAVTGSSGLIGTALIAELDRRGHRAIPVLRPGSREAGDEPALGSPGRDDRRGRIRRHRRGRAPRGRPGSATSAGPPDQKRRSLESRTKPTHAARETLAGLSTPPTVLVSGSAIGWYGNRGPEVLSESSPPPEHPDFGADVCRQWEAATAPAEAAGIRTVHLRTGIVLAGHGGVLPRMATPFKLGLGGRIGSGRQYMSWIALEDEVAAILHSVTHPDVDGPLNATAPTPATNAELTAALGHVLKRPTLLPTPVPALKLLYGGELVDALLLGGQRVVPDRLQATGFEFSRPDLEGALRTALHR